MDTADRNSWVPGTGIMMAPMKSGPVKMGHGILNMEFFCGMVT